MELKGSFPRLQEAATDPSPVTDEFGVRSPVLLFFSFKTNFNIILPFMPGSYKWYLSFGFSKLVCKVCCL
jgi:hypothetical protein